MIDYKLTIRKFIARFPTLKPYEMIKLNRYFVEYARQLAEKNNINTIKEYKRTSKLIKIYEDKGFDCFGTVWTILDTYDQIAKTQTQYKDCDTMFETIVTADEREELKCFLALLN